MSPLSDPGIASPPRRSLGLLAEALWVAGFGLVCALAANALSPRGLLLTRDYFPAQLQGSTNLNNSNSAAQAPPGTRARPGSSSPQERLQRRLRELGLQTADSNWVVRLFRDPRYELELFVMIDARGDEEYAQGHIPGAFQFDRYRPERHLSTVLPVCQTADRIAVYCNGGDCEDSEFAAAALRQAGIPLTNLWVYLGGLNEWVSNALPVELGPRKSGRLKGGAP